MTLWILTFVPVASGHAIKAAFHSEEHLDKVHKDALTAMKQGTSGLEFRDDFGKRYNIQMAQVHLVSMSCEQSAAADAALLTANQNAYAIYGLTLPTANTEPGSSMQ